MIILLCTASAREGVSLWVKVSTGGSCAMRSIHAGCEEKPPSGAQDYSKKADSDEFVRSRRCHLSSMNYRNYQAFAK
jgi:hypothetical protein